MWTLNWSREPGRMARLTDLDKEFPAPRWDGTDPLAPGATEPRLLLAGARFQGPPGREADAAEAWAFELKTYFKRGVGEAPIITSYRGGVYTVVGLITTTHSGDHPREDGIVWFT